MRAKLDIFLSVSRVSVIYLDGGMSVICDATFLKLTEWRQVCELYPGMSGA